MNTANPTPTAQNPTYVALMVVLNDAVPLEQVLVAIMAEPLEVDQEVILETPTIERHQRRLINKPSERIENYIGSVELFLIVQAYIKVACVTSDKSFICILYILDFTRM